MPNKYRKGGVKAEHTIIPGIGSLLQMVASCPYVHAVTPGRISRSPMGPSRPQLIFQYFQDTGLKLIGKTSTAVQEVFVVSSQKQEAFDWLITHKVVAFTEEQKPKYTDTKAAKTKRKVKPPAVYELTEASEITLQQYLERMRVESANKLSPLTDEQKKQLRKLKLKLEEIENNNKAQRQKKRQGQRRLPSHRTKRSRNEKQKQKTVKTPTTMEEWLEQTDKLSPEHWELLLRHFGQKND